MAAVLKVAPEDGQRVRKPRRQQRCSGRCCSKGSGEVYRGCIADARDTWGSVWGVCRVLVRN